MATGKSKKPSNRRVTYTNKKPTTNLQTKGKARQVQHSEGAKRRNKPGTPYHLKYARRFDPKY